MCIRDSIKPGRCVILGEGVHEPSVWQVMQDRCCECGVSPQVSSHEVLKFPAHLGDTLEFACETSRDRYECSLFKPLYQAQNAACAIFVAEEYLGRALDKGALAVSLDVYKRQKYGHEGNFVMGANIAGFEKVADAMLAQGVC